MTLTNSETAVIVMLPNPMPNNDTPQQILPCTSFEDSIVPLLFKGREEPRDKRKCPYDNCMLQRRCIHLR